MTIVTWSRGLQPSLDAAQALGDAGTSVEVIDLRTLWPWDRDAVLASVASIHGFGVRTNRPRKRKRVATGQNAAAKGCYCS